MRRSKISENAICHIFNRGVDKRQVFMDEDDYFRFVHDLWEFNDWAPAPNVFYRKKSLQSYEVKPRKDFARLGDAKKGMLVDLLAWCLMPNHFHLMVRQNVEGGIANFMQKLGTGYTIYFNQKQKRTGTLFESPYKIIEISAHTHFLYLPFYIHANPLDLEAADYQNFDIDRSKNFLNSYRWSSHSDYAGTANFPSIIKVNYLRKIFENEKKYAKEFFKWLSDREARQSAIKEFEFKEKAKRK